MYFGFEIKIKIKPEKKTKLTTVQNVKTANTLKTIKRNNFVFGVIF